MLKLDLGAGATSPEGFVPLGNAHGTPIVPLNYPDGAVDVIRASHCLEHFPGTEIVPILVQWVSKLKPGGELRIAVPNFEWIAQNYLKGEDINVQGYTMGGQTAPDDFHKAIFDEELLAEAMRLAGLIEIEKWDADLQDCSALPVSLNLKGVKPRKSAATGNLKIGAVMSVPRLGFMDNFFSAMEALAPMGIGLRRHMGAYWEACLERSMTDLILHNRPDLILTLDYDTVFKRSDVEKLAQIMQERPEVDALAPVQAARGMNQPLLQFDLPLGVKGYDHIPAGVFADEITELRTAHFGLTMIRVSSLEKLPKPWLWSQPAPDKTWGDGRIDADIYFWKGWREAGLKVFSANRVVVGHMELMVLWPGADFRMVPQLSKDYQTNGKPKGIWA